jgi:PAS domain-containing protein
MSSSGAAPKSLPLILAREFASNLATPMFLLDAAGMLVFYNDAAALLLGKSFAELGEMSAGDFAATLELATPAGESLLRRNSPAGIAFFQQRPAHASVLATTFDGARRPFEATAYPLFATSGDMHGVIAVFWEGDAVESTD